LNYGTSVNSKITTKDLSKPTPCNEWNIKDLAAHVLYELSWVPDIISGKTISEVGDKHDGNLMGDDFVAAWQKTAKKIEKTVKVCDLKATAHLSYMDTTNDYFLREQASDFLIHGWDMAAALGVNPKFDSVVAQEVYNDAKPKLDKWGGGEMFAVQIKVPVSADIQTKLLALFGRDINWRPKFST